MRREIGWWLEASERDGRMAASLAAEGLFEGSAFHLQQSAEKALLLKMGRESRTNSCVHLARMLGETGLDTDSISVACRKLDGHYIISRYPNGVGGPPADLYNEEIIGELQGCRDRIVGFVREHI